MPKQYRAEFFDREYNYVAHTPINEPVLAFDYLTLEGIDISFPVRSIPSGSFVSIIDNLGSVAYQGMVGSTEDAQGVTVAHIAPLLSLLDVSVAYDRTLLQDGPVEDFIAAVIMATYAANPDVLQNIPGVQCVVTSATRTYLNIKSNVHDLWDICSRSLTNYGVAISAAIDFQQKALTFTIGRVDGVKTIESDLMNCVSKSINIGEAFGGLNKAVYINKDNEQQVVTYYLHTDGSISTQDADRVVPVLFSTEYVESEEFEDDAHSRAMEALTPERHNNLIELTYAAADKLVRPASLQVGQVAAIVSNGAAYESMLTGWERTGEVFKLVFGNIRIDITKMLAIERRQNSAAQN